MRFFFPDSQDLVDPSFDFKTEKRDDLRIRQRDDLYAHEVFETPPYDGLLVSKAIVDGTGGSGGRYTIGQRQRLFREGGKEFFRLKSRNLKLMADCGAFSYVNEATPPFTVQEVIDFYELLGCDYGISVDHIILAYRPDWDTGLFGFGAGAPPDLKQRHALTIELADQFMRAHAAGGCGFEPVGVAQGWSPGSYRQAVESLQRIGYRYIALGGLVPLKTREILETLEGVAQVRRPDVRLHLLGVTRTDVIPALASYGVESFDSTSPLRQAFKDGKDNYYTPTRTYTALRVPQVEANPSLVRAIQAGRIRQEEARRLEGKCLESLRSYDAGSTGLSVVLNWLVEYEHLVDPKKDHKDAYREILEDKPWKACVCAVCRTLGHHVVLFRGAERNRRRGFHNVWITHERVRQQTGGKARVPKAKPTTRSAQAT